VEIVLKRRACEKQAVQRAVRAEDGGELRLVVFDAVRLVDDDVIPVDFAKEGHLDQHHLVCRDAEVERVWLQFVLHDLLLHHGGRSRKKRERSRVS
jgi:hypothetical protein